MKKNVFFSLVFVAVVAFNFNMLSSNDISLSNTLEDFMSNALASSPSEEVYCYDFVNEFDCIAFDQETGEEGNGCLDFCNSCSGLPCGGPVDCYYSKYGCL